jgi:hypothetical protein
MKQLYNINLLPKNAIILTCSSHEERCRGLVSRIDTWHPIDAIIFHYDDSNPKREENHRKMVKDLHKIGKEPTVLKFTEKNAVKSLNENMASIRRVLANSTEVCIVLDISVFTKRHLLIILRWLDDEGYWDRITIVYSEPEDYDVSSFVPLSFGLSCLQQIPGFSACPDLSRPIHLVLFLGYEGDRSLAVYEHIQPMQTTLIIPYPPYKPAWEGRTEEFNATLLATLGDQPTEKVDAIDPNEATSSLLRILGKENARGSHAKVICPLGTKPQTLGIYSYVRACIDPPAIIYASPLRHNHDFFSHGIGNMWILKQAKKI